MDQLVNEIDWAYFVSCFQPLKMRYEKYDEDKIGWHNLYNFINICHTTLCMNRHHLI